jgi:hypothetical protein
MGTQNDYVAADRKRHFPCVISHFSFVIGDNRQVAKENAEFAKKR